VSAGDDVFELPHFIILHAFRVRKLYIQYLALAHR
jgi:hypothetical protein